MSPSVVAVALSPVHSFSKRLADRIELAAGLGVVGDAHAGGTVKHRSRVAIDPTQPNLRQVHLIHAELFDELRGRGFEVVARELGENVTTRDMDLLGLPVETRLCLGASAWVQLTGLRNPCRQIEDFQPGLLAAVLDRDEAGRLVRKAGVMGIVLSGGEVRPGDPIEVELPPEPHRRLKRV